jgi:hypothetical protein
MEFPPMLTAASRPVWPPQSVVVEDDRDIYVGASRCNWPIPGVGCVRVQIQARMDRQEWEMAIKVIQDIPGAGAEVYDALS